MRGLISIRRVRRRASLATRLFASVCCFTVWIFALSANAQAWKQGQQSLMKNNFTAAESQLRGSLKSAKSKGEIAETYKYLGVAQYMSNKKQDALESFKKAKTANPGVRLTDAEVVDESVIPFFNAVKSPTSPAVKPPTTVAREPLAPPGAGKKKAKQTILKVTSNAADARISLDGIAYGVAGEEIEVQPGTVVIEVAANGYKSKSVRVKLAPQTTSSVTVDLEKIIPKPKPQPTPKALPLPDASLAAGSATGSKGGKGKAKAEGKNDLFGEDPLASSFQATPPQKGGIAPGPQMITPPAAPAQPVQPQQGFIQGQAPYGAQSPYGAQAPYPAPQVYQQPMMQQVPMYQPMPVYPMQPYPAAPYGGYAPPPNPYGYGAPPASVYQPYSPPPVTDPYGGYLGPPLETTPSALPPPVIDDPGAPAVAEPSKPKDSGGMPPPPRLPPPVSLSEGKKKASDGKSGGCSFFIKILPFGAGQFCSKSYLKALGLLGGQAASLYFYKSNSDTAAAYRAKLVQLMDERDSQRSQVSDADLNDYDAETEQKRKEGNAAIAKANQNATLSIASFGGLWAVGVLDAFLFEPTPSSKSKVSKGKKKRRSRIIQSYHLDLDRAPFGALALSMPYDPYDATDMDVLFGYVPGIDTESGKMKHAMTVGLKWEL